MQIGLLVGLLGLWLFFLGGGGGMFWGFFEQWSALKGSNSRMSSLHFHAVPWRLGRTELLHVGRFCATDPEGPFRIRAVWFQEAGPWAQSLMGGWVPPSPQPQPLPLLDFFAPSNWNEVELTQTVGSYLANVELRGGRVVLHLNGSSV